MNVQINLDKRKNAIILQHAEKNARGFVTTAQHDFNTLAFKFRLVHFFGGFGLLDFLAFLVL